MSDWVPVTYDRSGYPSAYRLELTTLTLVAHRKIVGGGEWMFSVIMELPRNRHIPAHSADEAQRQATRATMQLLNAALNDIEAHERM